jgi:beta-galactosidase
LGERFYFCGGIDFTCQTDHRIQADGKDLCFITVRIIDNQGVVAPGADNLLKFTVEGPGMIVATDKGDPANMVSFPSHERQAFNGFCLVIVCSIPDKSEPVILHAESELLQESRKTLRSTLAKTR